MFDKQDARLLVKTAIVVVGGSSLLLTVSAVFGLAWRVFGMFAG